MNQLLQHRAATFMRKSLRELSEPEICGHIDGQDSDHFSDVVISQLGSLTEGVKSITQCIYLIVSPY